MLNYQRVNWRLAISPPKTLGFEYPYPWISTPRLGTTQQNSWGLINQWARTALRSIQYYQYCNWRNLLGSKCPLSMVEKGAA